MLGLGLELWELKRQSITTADAAESETELPAGPCWKWLGGLDSNQDNQIQNLMYCQLYDLPAGGNKKGRWRDPLYTLLSAPRFVNPRYALAKTISLHRLPFRAKHPRAGVNPLCEKRYGS